MSRGSGRRGRARGRVIVALGLVGFVLVASGVVYRRSIGIGQARELRDMTRHRTQLLAERAALMSAVRVAASRGRIAPAAEKLGMRVPSDTQVVYLRRSPAPSPTSTP